MKNTSHNDTEVAWDNPDYESALNWVKDPCPAGWRLPKIAELAAVVNKTEYDDNDILPAINPLTNVPDPWVTPPGMTVFSNLKKSGDYLYLPAAGWRNNGDLANRGYFGTYWSSTSGGPSYGRGIYLYSERQYAPYQTAYYSTGLSVRCVEAE
jgi:uncharacterized protein (TIGR02145 family)